MVNILAFGASDSSSNLDRAVNCSRGVVRPIILAFRASYSGSNPDGSILLKKGRWKIKKKVKDDIRFSGIQGGRIIGEKISLFSFILGIPLIIVGFFALSSMILNFGFPRNSANFILISITIIIGILLTTGGYLIYKDKKKIKT